MRDTKIKGDVNARFKVLGTKTCIHCQILKALLKGKGYPFCEEENIEKVRELGFSSYPILVDNSTGMAYDFETALDMINKGELRFENK